MLRRDDGHVLRKALEFEVKNKTLHTVYTGLPVFLTEVKMDFFDTMENLHGPKLIKRILFYSVL